MFSGKRKGYSSYELEEIESDREELLTKASVTGREEFGGSVKTVNGHVKVMEQNPETERLLPKASVPGHDGLERIKAGKPLKVQVKVVMKEVGISSAEEMDHVHAWELLWLQSAQYPIWWYM